MLPLWEDAAHPVRVARLTETGEIEELVALFVAVAQQEHWQPGQALHLWQAQSVYFALEVAGKLAGGLQLVLPNSQSALPCQIVWPEVIPPVRAAHIAVLAVQETYRGSSRLFWHLAIEMWRYCVGRGITHVFIEVTPRVLPLYRRLGWPLVIQGDLRVHWGESCYLCGLGIPEVAEAILRRAEQSDYYHEIVAQAFRLVAVTSPTDKAKPRTVSAEPLQASTQASAL